MMSQAAKIYLLASFVHLNRMNGTECADGAHEVHKSQMMINCSWIFFEDDVGFGIKELLVLKIFKILFLPLRSLLNLGFPRFEGKPVRIPLLG